MITCFKEKIDPTQHRTVLMFPWGAKVISMTIRDDIPEINALVDTSHSYLPITFFSCYEDSDMEFLPKDAKFIGSYYRKEYLYHVFYTEGDIRGSEKYYE